MRTPLILSIAVLVLSAPYPGGAQVPSTLGYQAVLTNASGVVVADGTYSLTFRLYEVASGGTALWSETQSVTTSTGVFTAILGSVSTLNLAFDRPYWLGISVDGGAELSPRVALTSSAYALRASRVVDGGVTSAAILDGAVATADLANDAVTSAKISDGAIATADLASDAVTSAKVLDGTIATADLASDAVTSAKIVDATIAATDFAAGAVNSLDAADGSPTDAVAVDNNGNVGIGTTSPGGKLHVQDGSVLFAGTTGAIPATGAGTRLMWYPAKAAFRAGVVTGTQWDDASIGSRSTVGGGENNTASNGYATVGGGILNTASGGYATVGGGEFNTASGGYATVGGGGNNTASGQHATVGGGVNNTASSTYATVGGGILNTASSTYATVGGGHLNTASGQHATVGGGGNNTAAGNYSFATGFRAKIDAAHDGSFLFADQSNFDFNSAALNEFAVRATGGARFVSAIDGSGTPTAGVQLAAGGTSWAALSDRNAKTNFAPVDSRQILTRLASLPIQTWNNKSQDPSIRHIGPMAQDFYAAFGVGEDERHITTLDADGVALAAIQGLYQMLQEKEGEVAALAGRVEALVEAFKAQQREIEALKARVEALEGPDPLTSFPVEKGRTGWSSVQR